MAADRTACSDRGKIRDAPLCPFRGMGVSWASSAVSHAPQPSLTTAAGHSVRPRASSNGWVPVDS